MATTKRAAKKATASKAKAAPAEEDEPDILADIKDEDAGAPEDDEEFDLLDELDEDDGVAWKPADDEEQPRGIQGRVTFIGEIEKDQRFGGGMAPMIGIQSKDGTKWSLRGYHRVLANKIDRMLERGLKVGDFAAFKYFGTRTGKADNDYENYGADFRAR